MRNSTLTILLTGLLGAGAALAQSPPQARLHLDSAALKSLEAQASNVSDVTLDGAVLKLGLAFLNRDNSGMSQDMIDSLAKLEGVYVKQLDFKSGGAPALADAALAPVRAQLKAPCWSRIVSAHSSRDHESDEVYVCMDGQGTIHGLAVLSRQADELDLVNIVGSITPDQLSHLGGQFGIPAIHIDESKGKKTKKGGGE